QRLAVKTRKPESANTERQLNTKTRRHEANSKGKGQRLGMEADTGRRALVPCGTCRNTLICSSSCLRVFVFNSGPRTSSGERVEERRVEAQHLLRVGAGVGSLHGDIAVPAIRA